MEAWKPSSQFPYHNLNFNVWSREMWGLPVEVEL